MTTAPDADGARARSRGRAEATPAAKKRRPRTPPGAAPVGEIRYPSLVRHTSDVLSVVDAEGVVQHANPAIKRLVGYAPEQVVGTAVGDWIHPDDRPRVWAAFLRRRTRPEMPPEPMSFRVRHADGSWRWVEASVAGLVGDAGSVQFVVSSRDVTERVEAEEALRASDARLRALFAAMDDVILVLDVEGRYLEVAPTNPAPSTGPAPS